MSTRWLHLGDRFHDRYHQSPTLVFEPFKGSAPRMLSQAGYGPIGLSSDLCAGSGNFAQGQLLFASLVAAR